MRMLPPRVPFVQQADQKRVTHYESHNQLILLPVQQFNTAPRLDLLITYEVLFLSVFQGYFHRSAA